MAEDDIEIRSIRYEHRSDEVIDHDLEMAFEMLRLLTKGKPNVRSFIIDFANMMGDRVVSGFPAFEVLPDDAPNQQR